MAGKNTATQTATQPNAAQATTQQQAAQPNQAQVSKANSAWAKAAANNTMQTAAQKINTAMQGQQTKPTATTPTTTATAAATTPAKATATAQPSAQTKQNASTTQEATGGVYQVQPNGQAPKGLKVGDQVVTGGGTYTITGVNPDGTYTSKLTNAQQKTSNYTGQYATMPNVTANATGSTGAKKTTSQPSQPQRTQGYDPNVDYEAELAKAVAAGDLEAAAIIENARNTKIDAMGLGDKYAKTYQFADYLNGADPARAAQLLSGYSVAPITYPDNPTEAMRSLVEQMSQSSLDQLNGQIDYATEQAVLEQKRAVEDAQPEFEKRLKDLDTETARAMANSAMYAEMRGDRGGIGQSQYNEVQAQALANKQAIKAEQTKLATDAARAVADARAKGEFEKADAVWKVAQQKLADLYEIEKYNAEFGMSKAEFDQSVAQWKANFALQEAPYTGMYQGQQTLQAMNDERDYMASLAEMKLKQFGVMPTAEELAALNMTEADAQRILWNLGFSTGNFNSAGSSGGSGSSYRTYTPSPSADQVVDTSIKVPDATGNAAAVKAINAAMMAGDSQKSVNSQIIAAYNSGNLTYDEAKGLIDRNTGIRAMPK